MALLQDLIQQIDDPALRERILQETNKLLKQKKFGLVFEEHLPECTPLYDVPIRVGSKVALKTGYVSDIYTVINIDGDEVQCDRRETHEQKIFKLDELVTMAEFGEPIYPTLKQIDAVENAPDSGLWHTLIEADNYHARSENDAAGSQQMAQTETSEEEDLFDREEVMKFINDAGLLSYNVRALRINDYLKSLYRMAHLLTMSKLHREAIREVQDEIVEMIHSYVEVLKADGKYDDLVQQVKQFKLATQIFDAFGETVDNYSVHDMFTTTDTDIERQFQIADVKLGREGIGMAYGNKYMDMSDVSAFKVDVILFVADEECMNRLHSYAETRFHGLNDDYRRYIATIDSEKIRKEYDSIVSDGDPVSKHNFRLPETIQVPHEVGGKEYRNHLFVSDITGVATMKLNTWEAGVIEEEEKREDFVCWIRNPSRGSWALCIPYEIDGETKPTYPDFIVVRKDCVLGYVVDILEPHNPDFKDNLGKAKGFAEYAKQNPGVGRIQLIRMSKDAAGKHKFKRLDMSKTAIREKVSHAINTDELDHIFDTDGVIE